MPSWFVQIMRALLFELSLFGGLNQLNLYFVVVVVARDGSCKLTSLSHFPSLSHMLLAIGGGGGGWGFGTLFDSFVTPFCSLDSLVHSLIVLSSPPFLIGCFLSFWFRILV